MATPAMIHTRTRSRWYMESPIRRAASPLVHKGAIKHVSKRRRIGMSSLNVNRLPPPSSDTDSNRDSHSLPNRFSLSSPRTVSRTHRRSGVPRRPKPLPLSGDEQALSPRKRKRSDIESVSDESWIETEDEMPEFIAEDDQHLLQMAPASALHRLRKSELVRLWKVCGMWSDDDEEGNDISNLDLKRGLSKVDLVNGLIKARKQAAAHEPSALQDHKPTSRESGSSSLASPPSSSGDSQLIRDVGVEVSPRAPRRWRGRQRPPLDAVNRKERQAKISVRPKGTGRRDTRKARFDQTVKSPSQKATRLRQTRSSTVSSQYATTSDGSNDPSCEVDLRKPPRHPPRRAVSIVSGVERTPIARRLRPRTRGSASSNGSTEVDADQEDNADAESVSAGNSRQFKRSESTSTRETLDRRAKREALRAMQPDSSSNEEESNDEQDIDHSTSPPSQQRRCSSRTRSGSRSGPVTRSRQNSTHAKVLLGDPIQIDSPPHSDVDVCTRSRTTRSGRAFGDIQERSESTDDVDDDSLEEEEVDEPGGWGADASLAGVTHASLMRLRRDQLVQMCEQRNLEVGGTKPQLAAALITWQRDERLDNLASSSTTSSQGTARPSSPVLMSAVLTHNHRKGEDTPILQRKHIHAEDPATPRRSSDKAPRTPDNDLNLDLQELGLEDFTIQPESLQKMGKIGSGGFKDVYVGKLRGRKVAISEFREHLSEMDIRELKLLAEFRHPNIVRFRGICIPEDTSQVPCMLISELCENGDLFDYIRNVSTPSLKRVLRIMLDIARGLEYLHLRNPAVIHRDCKSTNILINKQGVAKVGDFGLARVKQSTRSMIRSLVGTVNWQAPELWHPHPKYDYKVDVFSVALVYWEMLSGWIGEPKYPWEGHNEHYIYDAVGQKHKRPPLTGLRKHWGAEPVNLIERMWHQDPAERPTMSDVVADLEALLAECT
ncbi:kinase-like protein [Cutaneotrichosporon oleaginosum]|uniref:Kinase-like protein n=1 Tax=Cutaneotrichosporon oleaginosum TaxID=879819 RepID=A0A0J0XFD0_9TREE|nr:kinase-like protein [Cutaneotrichosporon oleaginosum]KLT39753.1 kinase-like protein [Cutaneotrichosporon oleaginosum]TXT12237.1 hypothetical protein COLE_02647 [Cutaneotrichosporon oleaginosum]